MWFMKARIIVVFILFATSFVSLCVAVYYQNKSMDYQRQAIEKIIEVERQQNQAMKELLIKMRDRTVD